MVHLGRVPHRVLAVDHVGVTAADSARRHVAAGNEVRDDPLARALGDPDALGHVPETNLGVLRQTEENLGVVREERPGR